MQLDERAKVKLGWKIMIMRKIRSANHKEALVDIKGLGDEAIKGMCVITSYRES